MITSNVFEYLEREHLAPEKVPFINKRRLVLIHQRHCLHEQLYRFDALANPHVQRRSVMVSEEAGEPFRSALQVAS